MNRNHRGILTVLATMGLAAAGTAVSAQVEINGAGRMLGSTIADRINPRNRDRDRDRWPAPRPGFTGGVGFIPGSGYTDCGQSVIIVNNSPCYVPSYYGGGGYGSYGYGNGGFSVSFQTGGLSLGYRQNNGYYRSNGYVSGGQVHTREIIREYVPVDRGNAQEDRSVYDVRVREENSARRAPAKPGGSGENDYYLHQKPVTRNPALAAAIRDIETAFRSGSIASLERHIDANGTLVLQIKGTSRRDIPAQDYLAMTADALKLMKTAKYELTKVEPASNGAVMVTGTHSLTTEAGESKSFIIGFILKQRGESWLITEVSAEPAK